MLVLSLMPCVICLITFTLAVASNSVIRCPLSNTQILEYPSCSAAVLYDADSDRNGSEESQLSHVKAITRGYDSTQKTWSQRPICIRTDEVEDGRLCLFTSTRFNNGSGLSVITTPSIAASIVALVEQLSLDPLADGIPTSNRNIVSNGFPNGIHINANDDQRSLGTAKYIYRNEQYLVDLPLLIIHESLYALQSPEIERFLQLAASHLPLAMQKQIFSMAEQGNRKDKPEFLLPILISHGGFIMEFHGSKHFTLPPMVAFLDHDCAPNSFHSVNSTTLEISVRAARAIHPGKQLTISYIAEYPHWHFKKFQDRVELIKDNLRFSCACRRCSLGPLVDSIWAATRQYQLVLDKQVLAGLDVDISAAMQLVAFYKAHGFDIFLDIAYEYVVRAYSAIGDKVSASKYTQKIADILLWNGIEDGVRSDQ